jgi:hypothetical protein
MQCERGGGTGCSVREVEEQGAVGERWKNRVQCERGGGTGCSVREVEE